MEDYEQFFGLLDVDDDIPEFEQEKIRKKMEEIYDRHYSEAEKELKQILEPMGLEIAMGMMVKKGDSV